MDLVPFVGEIDDFVTSGAKGLDEALGDLNSVRKAGEEGTEARCVFNCASSFAAETRVLMADGSTKRIGDVKPGDLVMSADPQTGEQAQREVIATLPHTDDLLLFDTTAGRVVTTEDHRYWNATDGEWQESQNLDVGDRFLSADGDVVRVGGLDWSTVHTAPAYDLTIADFHTFYVAVGNEHILVHNNECTSRWVDDAGNIRWPANRGFAGTPGNVNPDWPQCARLIWPHLIGVGAWSGAGRTRCRFR